MQYTILTPAETASQPHIPFADLDNPSQPSFRVTTNGKNSAIVQLCKGRDVVVSVRQPIPKSMAGDIGRAMLECYRLGQRYRD